MKIRVNVFTSCYSKMLKRHKGNNDIYIQISRNLGRLGIKKTVDNEYLSKLIDLNAGGIFGFYEVTFKEYEERICSKECEADLKELAKLLSVEGIKEIFGSEEIRSIEKEIEAFEKAKKEAVKQTVEERKKDWNNFTLEEKDGLYAFGFKDSFLDDISKWNPEPIFNIFLLCFEDLNEIHTKQDEEKNPYHKAGTFKQCHRTVLAHVLNERYKTGIVEWQE